MTLELFFEIVELYNTEVARLQGLLNAALNDDEADAQEIADFQAKYKEWENTANQIAASFSEYKAQDTAEDQRLVDAMTEVRNRLQSV